MSIDIPWFASVKSSKNTFEKSCLICDTLCNVAYFRQLNFETMRVVSLLEHVDTTEVAGKWEIFRLQTSMSDQWLCRKLDPEETYYFLPLLTPGTWNVTSCEHMDRSSYNFFWTNTWGQVCYKFHDVPCIVHYKGPFELGFSHFARHRWTQLRLRGVEFVKVGELIHWKHMHSTSTTWIPINSWTKTVF